MWRESGWDFIGTNFCLSGPLRGEHSRMDRYSVDGSEGEFQPGSDGLVLRNKLGLIDPLAIREAELELLLKLYRRVFKELGSDEPLSVAMIMEWHRRWLGNLYDWAGKERLVNVSKDGFTFAAARQIPCLLGEFERQQLAKLTPCQEMGKESLVSAIAEVHVELILIHPFREGNGRVARLVADVMAHQAGFGELDYTPWDQRKDKYFQAIQVGMGREYGPMEELVRRALDA